jgi:hypothetical protein
MAKTPTTSKGAPAADQQQEAKSDQATNTSSEAMASTPATAGQPSLGAESGSSAENAGSSLGSNEQGQALNTHADAPVEAAASPTAGATADDNSASAGDLASLQEQPAKQAYAVTGRSDVLHDGKLYTEGELVWLDWDSARPLLNNRCVTATGGTQ